jgi:hypothetical protein
MCTRITTSVLSGMDTREERWIRKELDTLGLLDQRTVLELFRGFWARRGRHSSMGSKVSHKGKQLPAKSRNKDQN